MQPGRHEDMPAAEYHAAPGLGSTGIRTIAQHSVAHYLAGKAKEASPAMRTGSLNHCAVLEPERLRDEYWVAPRHPCPKCPSGRLSQPGAMHCHQHGGKAESQAWHDALPPGAEVVTAEEKDDARILAEGVRASVARSDHPGLLAGGAREVSYCVRAVVTTMGYDLHTEGTKGILLRARVDIEHPGLCVDLKGVGQLGMLDPRRWSWRIRDYGMHIQAALYCDIIEAVTGTRPAWGWLVHQSEAPYATRLFVADEDDLTEARSEILVALQRWQAYQEHGDAWAGWPTHKQVVSMPGRREEI